MKFWIKRFLEDLKILNSLPIKIYCDNKTTISIAYNPVLHDRIKHMKIDKYFIKEKINSGVICIPNVSTTEQVVNVLTNGYHKKQFDYLIGMLAMEDILKLA